jgi:predicted dehydrogenase
MTGITCILKNQFGITPIKKKSQYHTNLSEVIYDLNLLKKPDLSLIDGIIAMEGSGPVDGIPKPIGLLIAGNDPVATDHACARIMGIPMRMIPSLKLALKKGLGSKKYKVVGVDLEKVKDKFASPFGYKTTVAKIYTILSKIVGIMPRAASGQRKVVTSPIKIGVVGLGAVSEQLHLPVLASIDFVEIAAACEADPLRRDRRKERWNIPNIYKDYEEMYNESDLDAVFICLPNSMHFDAVKSALKHGLHVFCEKPLGMSAEKAFELVKIAKEKNLLLGVGYIRMLAEGYKNVADMVLSGKLGQIYQVHGVLANAGPYVSWIPRSDWFLRKGEGGVLYDTCSHLFSILVYALSDRIAEVSGAFSNTYKMPDTYDQVSGFFKTEKGIIGTYNAGWRAATESESVEIIGSAGTALVNPYGIEERFCSSGPIEKIVYNMKSSWKVLTDQLNKMAANEQIDEYCYKEDFEFLKAVQGEGRPAFNGEAAVHVLAVLEAINRSFDTGGVIEVQKFNQSG